MTKQTKTTYRTVQQGFIALATAALVGFSSAPAQAFTAAAHAPTAIAGLETAAVQDVRFRGGRGFRSRGFRGGRGFNRGFRGRGFRSRGFRSRGFNRGFRSRGFNRGFGHRSFKGHGFHHGLHFKGGFLGPR